MAGREQCITDLMAAWDTYQALEESHPGCLVPVLEAVAALAATRPKPDLLHRAPVDGDEAVLALRAGVLERNMDGIPHGPGGWEKCMLIEEHVRRGLGRFRVPADWTPEP